MLIAQQMFDFQLYKMNFHFFYSLDDPYSSENSRFSSFFGCTHLFTLGYYGVLTIILNIQF